MNVSFRFAYQIVSFIDTKKEIFRVEGEKKKREERERERRRGERGSRILLLFFLSFSIDFLEESVVSSCL